MRKKQIINILTNTNLTCFLIPSLFTSEQCKYFIQRGKQLGFKKAIDNYPTYYRNNQRLIINDQILAKQLFNKIKHYLPQKLSIQHSMDTNQNGIWAVRSLNSLIRFCRYQPMQYFNKHLDGIHHRSPNIQSKLTFMIYLNSAQGNFTGGKTLFYQNQISDHISAEYTPHEGDLIIFDHNIWHKGEIVQSGEKYVMRSDIIYEKIEESSDRWKSQQSKFNFCQGHRGYIWSLLSWNNQFLISGGRDKVIKIWNMRGEQIQELNCHQNSVLSLQRLDESYLASCSRDKHIITWKLMNKQFILHKKWMAHNSTVLTLLTLSDKLIASGGADSKIKIFQIQSTNLVKQLQGHQNWVWKILSINSQTIVSCSEDKTVRIWDWHLGAQIKRIQHQFSIHSLAYQPYNKYLFYGDIDGNLLCYSFEEEKLLWKMKAHLQMIRCICVISSKKVATGSQDGWIRIWNTKSPNQNTYSFKHNNFVEDLCLFNGDLMSASYDGKICKIDRIFLQ